MSIRTITYNKHDFAKNAYKIMVDIDDQELKKPTFIPDMPICTDVNLFLRRMMEMDYTPNPEHEDWIKWCRMMVEKYPACLPEYHHDSKDELLNPYVFVDTLFELNPDIQLIFATHSPEIIGKRRNKAFKLIPNY